MQRPLRLLVADEYGLGAGQDWASAAAAARDCVDRPPAVSTHALGHCSCLSGRYLAMASVCAAVACSLQRLIGLLLTDSLRGAQGAAAASPGAGRGDGSIRAAFDAAVHAHRPAGAPSCECDVEAALI